MGLEFSKLTTMYCKHPFMRAAETKDLETFLKILFPVNWYPIISRIIESGAQFDEGLCKWSPRWSNIPFTMKTGENELEAAFKSCMYRVHDSFHQLWGLPIPSKDYTDNEYYLFKRAQMCGEVAVLTLTEFIFGKIIYDEYPNLKPFLEKRCAVVMMKDIFHNKTPVEIATRLDGLLHKKIEPKWVRENHAASLFCKYYVPMLENDRTAIDNNWFAMVKENWLPPLDAPNTRYSEELDGLELTIWLIQDFYHLLKTDSKIDRGLAEFNKQRRSKIILPNGWS